MLSAAWLRRRSIAKHPVSKLLERDEIMDDSEMARVQKYLQDKFGNTSINLKERPQSDGSVEVYLADEFIGVIYKDDEDGDVSFDFNMSILEFDLPTVAGISSK